MKASYLRYPNLVFIDSKIDHRLPGGTRGVQAGAGLCLDERGKVVEFFSSGKNDSSFATSHKQIEK